MLNKLKRSLMGSNPTGPAASTGLAASTVERDDEGTKSSEPKFAGSTDESLPDGVYEVERIILHQGNLKQKSQMRFLVRWKGKIRHYIHSISASHIDIISICFRL